MGLLDDLLLRSEKGSKLTAAEHDVNYTLIGTAVDLRPLVLDDVLINVIKPTFGGSTLGSFADSSSILGGTGHYMNGYCSSIISGNNGIITGGYNLIGTGVNLYITNSYSSSVITGYYNYVSGSTNSSVLQGNYCGVDSSVNCMIVSGDYNAVYANSKDSLILCGYDNGINNGDRCAILGGYYGTISNSLRSAIVGGGNSTIDGFNDVFILGSNITADASNTTFTENIKANGVIVFKEFTVATLPNVVTFKGGAIMVSNETGGYVLAFSDGANWRRSTDRAIVS